MNRRGFLEACLLTASAPAIVRIGSLMPISAPKLWHIEQTLKDFDLADIKREGTIITMGSHPKLLWPGVKLFWDEFYKIEPIYWTEFYKEKE